MADIVRTYNLEEAKKNIKKFSETSPEFTFIESVNSRDSRFWGFGSKEHTVTGEELNKLNNQVTDNLIEQITHIRALYEEFGQVFNAIEALDKDYVTGILGALTKAEDAIGENAKTLTKVEDTQNKLSQTVDSILNVQDTLRKEQQELKIEVVSKLAEKLKSVKEELQGKVSQLESSVASLSSNLTSINSAVAQTDSKVDAQVANYNTAIQDIGGRLGALEALKGLESKVSAMETKLTEVEQAAKEKPTNTEAAKQSNTLPIICAVISIVAVAADIALRVFGIL